MCGICGIYGFNDSTLLKKMCSVITHRGPDDLGSFSDDDIELGVCRLSIIDVKGGHQPIHNEDDSIWVAFNGEIYNFLELRRKLDAKGHKFYTSSDTEVILHLYEEFGPLCVHQLRGMFAFALWDGRTKELILARDRLGIKPLYYMFKSGNFLFASEIKSILQFKEIERRVNFEAFSEYLTLRYIPAPNTMFDGIMKLPPRTLATVKKDTITTLRYWYPIHRAPQGSMAYYEECIETLLRDSVRMRLMSEVPLGLYLSGGLDSSLVASLMSLLVEEPIKTFTVGFGQEDDEVDYARQIADLLEADHHEFVIDGSTLYLLPEVVWYLDEPVSDPTTIPTLLLSQQAKKYVTVVLTGEGGDELFSGYEHEKAMLLAHRYEQLLHGISRVKLKEVVKRLPIKLLDKLFNYPSSMGVLGRERLASFLSLQGDKAGGYALLVSAFLDGEKQELTSIKGTKRARDFFEPFFKGGGGLAYQLQSIDCCMWLPNYILTRLDKMTMAKAVEGRVPLLDHKLVELTLEIPNWMRAQGFTEKYILRRIASKFLPKEIVMRKKRTFITPVHRWGEDELIELCNKVLTEKERETRRYFSSDYVKKILQKYPESKLICGRQLWTLLTFEAWHRVFIEGDNLVNPKLSIDTVFG